MTGQMPIATGNFVGSVSEMDADTEPVSVEVVLVIKATADLSTSYYL